MFNVAHPLLRRGLLTVRKEKWDSFKPGADSGILYISPISGAYPINEEKAGSELVNEVLGRVVKELLRPGEKLHVHELIASLWRLQQGSPESAVRDACEQAIRRLARKLN